MNIVEKLCGKELASTPYAFGTLLRKGVHLSYGTDCPLTDSIPASAWTWRRLWMPTPWRAPMRSSRRTSRAA